MPRKLLNNSAKIITVFLIIIAFLLVSMTAVSMFFFQKEIEHRKVVEASLNEAQGRASKLEDELKETKKQAFLLEEKNKEADERINSLLDELELQEALKAEMKNESASLKDQLQKEIGSKEQVRKELLDDLSQAEQKIVELEAQVKAAVSRQEELKANLQNQTPAIDSRDVSVENASSASTDDGKVQLDKIVVVPNEVPQGRVLSIDTDTEFVIINLGDKDGVKSGDMLTISRGQEYLGDVKVTRVQAEMSAADLIPPLSSKILRKNDQVVLKQ
jgi:actin-related protein